MQSETDGVDLAHAQRLFEALPGSMQWPTLSPRYVGADALRDAASTPVFLVHQEHGGCLIHGVHEARIPGQDACDWQSPYGYGGPLSHGLDAAGLARGWRRFGDIARRRGAVAEFVRFHPCLGNHRDYPGRVIEDRHVVAMDLDPENLTASYSGRARTAIRKAEREGLSADWIDHDDAVARFPDFYRQCMREIDATDFYLFPDAYFAGLLALASARVLAIRRGGDTLSMGVFLWGPTQVEYHLSGTLKSARQSGATNLLLHTAALAARQAGRRTLYLGGGTSARADDPLLRFKRSFAEPGAFFRIGSQIHDPTAYETLRRTYPDRAASGRVLFYRS